MLDDDPYGRAPIHASVIGEQGQRVVFLHGLFGQGKNFTQIARALEPRVQSILVDLPNHGRSAWTHDFSYVATADTVASWLESTWASDGPVSVVGHSMGGKTAMVLALRHPQLVDKLVVADISPTVSAGADEFVALLDALAAVDLPGLQRRGDAEDFLASRIGNPTVRSFLLQNLRNTPDGFVWQANLDLLRRELAAIGDFPTIDAQFERPVLWIAGENSGYVSKADEPQMRRYFPATRLVTFKDTGHWVHSERPELFVEALRAFLLAP